MSEHDDGGVVGDISPREDEGGRHGATERASGAASGEGGVGEGHNDELRATQRKIAIIGTAPGFEEAPFADESWEIWGLSRLYDRVPRISRWFELHHWENVCKTWTVGEETASARAREVYTSWLETTDVPVYVQDAYVSRCQNGHVYPIDLITRLFKRRYFTNTVSYLMALAIMEHDALELQSTTVGLWGIDMELSESGNNEYGLQRPSLEYFCGAIDFHPSMALYVPQRSSLLKARELYAFEFNPMFFKARQKQTEVKDLKAKAEEQLASAQQIIAGCTGALEIMDWQLNNWPGTEV